MQGHGLRREYAGEREGPSQFALMIIRLRSSTRPASPGRKENHRFSHIHSQAFTLIETVGILAVITVLVFVLIPRIMEAHSNARVNHTVLNLHTIKSAVIGHFAASGSLASSNSLPLTFSGAFTNYDNILVAEGHIDKPFAARIGKEVFIRIVEVHGFDEDTEVDGSNGAYDLNGDGDNDVLNAGYTIEAVFLDVPASDAKRINDRIDGPNMAENPGQNDMKGQVIYHRPTPKKKRNVHIYITHR